MRLVSLYRAGLKEVINHLGTVRTEKSDNRLLFVTCNTSGLETFLFRSKSNSFGCSEGLNETINYIERVNTQKNKFLGHFNSFEEFCFLKQIELAVTSEQFDYEFTGTFPYSLNP